MSAPDPQQPFNQRGLYGGFFTHNGRSSNDVGLDVRSRLAVDTANRDRAANSDVWRSNPPKPYNSRLSTKQLSATRMMNPMLPNRKQFIQDPAGYSRSAWMRWAMIASVNGVELDPFKQPGSEDLKNPLLWLTQAEAMSQAALVLIEAEPSFDNLPAEMRGICDSQYCAVALMLVGYSLEVCLKAMILVKAGVEAYSEAERKYLTHDLKKLATFFVDLDAKDLAILELLTHFIAWAGRYPDPGSRYIDKHDSVFELAEQNQISGHDLFKLVSKVMRGVSALTEAQDSD